MPTAYSYTRFSSPKQSHGRSEDRQAEAALPWCHQNGYTLDETIRLRDRGKSAYHGINFSNGDLGAFLSLVEQGLIVSGSVLLIEHTDRFTRLNPMDGLNLVQRMVSGGVDIVTLFDGQRYSIERLKNDIGCFLMLSFTLFQGHQESDKKSKCLLDVWKNKRAMARERKVITSRVPSWIDKTTRELIPAKVLILKRMFQLAKDGTGPSKIAKLFNAEGVPRLGAGKKWSSSGKAFPDESSCDRRIADETGGRGGRNPPRRTDQRLLQVRHQ